MNKKILSVALVFTLAISMLSTSAFVVDTKAVSREKNLKNMANAFKKSVDKYYKTHQIDKNGNMRITDEDYEKAKNDKSKDSNNDKYVAPYTSVKSQRPFGSCWMFGGIAAAESSLLHKAGYGQGKAKRDPVDLSEAQGICTTYNSDKDQNGNEVERSSNDIRIITTGWGDYYGFKGGAWPIDSAITLSAEKGSALENDNPFLSNYNHQEYYEDYDNKSDAEKETHKKKVIGYMLSKAMEQYNLNRFHLKSVEQLPEVFLENGKYNNEFAYEMIEGNRDIWKSKIKNNGAIYAMFYQNHEAKHYHCWGEDKNKYSSDNSIPHYLPNYWNYSPRGGGDQNHVVSIVGYDDTYSKYNFAERYKDLDNTNPKSFDSNIAHIEWIKENNGEAVMTSEGSSLRFTVGEKNQDGYAEYIVPNNDGAWMIKNSYGIKGGDGKPRFDKGIEYMSYYESSFKEPISLVVEESISQINNNKKVYDTTLTHSSLMGHPIEGLDKDAKAAEIYKLGVDTKIEQVGYWTGKNNTVTNIEIRKNLSNSSDPTSGTLVCTINNKQDEYIGYHTVKIPEGVVLDRSSKMSVIISQECDGTSALMIESDKKDVAGMGYKFKSIPGDTLINNNDNAWVGPENEVFADNGIVIGNSTVKLFGNTVDWIPFEYDGEDVDDQYSFNSKTMKNIDISSRYIKSYFARNEGVMVNVPNDIKSVSVNGKTENVATYVENEAVIDISALNQDLNIIRITYEGGKGYLEIRNIAGEVSSTEENLYCVDDYINGEERTYPKKDGKIFAGWFTDSSCTEPFKENSGQAYAKFIDECVLDTKFQWKEDDSSAVRFVSSLDRLNYDQAGFIFEGDYGKNIITTKRKSIDYVYQGIKADGITYKASDVFSDDSNYFFTYTVRGLDSDTDSSWDVRAFFVTEDGTTVIGDKSVNNKRP